MNRGSFREGVKAHPASPLSSPSAVPHGSSVPLHSSTTPSPSRQGVTVVASSGGTLGSQPEERARGQQSLARASGCDGTGPAVSASPVERYDLAAVVGDQRPQVPLVDGVGEE